MPGRSRGNDASAEIVRGRGNVASPAHRITGVKAQLDWSRAGLGAIAGLLTGAVAVGAGQLVAGITSPDASPVVAVGQLQIDFTPPAVKNFAIRAFGSHDKLVLVSGILVVLALFAAALGALAMRRLRYGPAGLAVFAVIGVIGAATRPAASAADALPALAAAAAAVIAMPILIRAASTARPGAPQRQAVPAGQPAGTAARLPASSRPAESAAPSQRSAPAPGNAARGGMTSAGPQPGILQPERRRFLVVSAGAAGTAAAGVLAGRALAERFSVAGARASLRIRAPAIRAPALPLGAGLRIPGLSPFITPNGAFYRVDTAVLPQVVPESWQLRIHGMVRREISISFAELIRRPLIEDYITLCCVSNPVGGPYIGNALWLGASLASLLRQAGIRAGADQLLCTSSDGFTSGVPVPAVLDGRDALLAVAMNGTPLPVAHGFPVRMVVPGLYGYVSACKWLTDIEATTYAANTAYWAQRGWDAQAPIKTESRIDVPKPNSPLTAGKTRVAGVGWAQHKGIDAVEVRATDKTGYTQTAVQTPPEPNGATGHPSVSVTVH